MEHELRIEPGAQVNCRCLSAGAGCLVKTGSRIDCDRLFLGEGTIIEAGVCIQGAQLQTGHHCRIGEGTLITIKEYLQLGDRCSLGKGNVWDVRRATVGRELWTGPQVRIGGGSWAEVHSELSAGYWLHLGMRTFVNTARKVSIGNEVGIGTGSAIFTHGAYQSGLAGFPVAFAPITIGDNCWIPGAVINPGVTIGRNAVIGVGSVVTRSIPEGALAAGVPCRIIRENAFPRPLSENERQIFLADLFRTAAAILSDFTRQPAEFIESELVIRLPDCTIRYQTGAIEVFRDLSGFSGSTQEPVRFLLDEKRITGTADAVTEKLRDLLRRYGIRFFADIADGTYYDWRVHDSASNV